MIEQMEQKPFTLSLICFTVTCTQILLCMFDFFVSLLSLLCLSIFQIYLFCASFSMTMHLIYNNWIGDKSIRYVAVAVHSVSATAAAAAVQCSWLKPLPVCKYTSSLFSRVVANSDSVSLSPSKANVLIKVKKNDNIFLRLDHHFSFFISTTISAIFDDAPSFNFSLFTAAAEAAVGVVAVCITFWKSFTPINSIH